MTIDIDINLSTSLKNQYTKLYVGDLSGEVVSVMTGEVHTGISSHLGAKLRDWAARQAEAGCYSWAAMSSNDSKTRYQCQ